MLNGDLQGTVESPQQQRELMPNAPKTFRPAHLPSREQVRKEYDQRRGSARERGYDKQWESFRAWYFSFPCNVLCACGCGQLAEELDHIEGFEGKHDPKRLDLLNVAGLTGDCHKRKTILCNKGFGNRMTPEGQQLIQRLKMVAKERAAIMENS